MQKTVDGLEDLENRLESWLTDIENKVTEANNRAEGASPTQGGFVDILGKLNKTENTLVEEIAALKEGLHDHITKKVRDLSGLMEKAQMVLSEVIFIARGK